MKLRTLYIGVIFVVSILSSCKKFVTLEDAPGLIPTQSIFADSASATSAVVGFYALYMEGTTITSSLNGRMTLFPGLLSDELARTSSNGFETPFYQNALTAQSDDRAIWRNLYQYIYHMNACIEGVNASAGISGDLKLKLTAECKFWRAFCFFLLTNLYGDVPLTISTDYSVNNVLPRTEKSKVYELVQADLEYAVQNLPVTYVSPGRKRPNKYAAMAFLSKIHLYLKQWQNAESLATTIINSGIYSLESDLNRVFLSGSNEALLQLQPVRPGGETPEGNTFVPTSSTSRPTYILQNTLLNSFETNDLRRTNWVKKNTSGGVDYYYPFKYKLRQAAGTTPVENYMVLRLAEAYLIRAEARAEQGKLFGAGSAEADLNVIRNRAGLPNTTVATEPALKDAIAKERRNELFLEWGNRWFDLIRTNKVNDVMQVITPLKGGTWQTTDQLLPIRFSELQLNPFLTQNLGY